jgi:transposase
MVLSLDIRKRVVESYENNEGTIKLLAKRFKIGSSTLERWLRQKRETGTLFRKLATGRPKKIDEKGLKWLEKKLHKNDALTLAELARVYNAQFNVLVCRSTLHYACKRIKMNYKKNIFSSGARKTAGSRTAKAI